MPQPPCTPVLDNVNVSAAILESPSSMQADEALVERLNLQA